MECLNYNPADFEATFDYISLTFFFMYVSISLIFKCFNFYLYYDFDKDIATIAQELTKNKQHKIQPNKQLSKRKLILKFISAFFIFIVLFSYIAFVLLRAI